MPKHLVSLDQTFIYAFENRTHEIQSHSFKFSKIEFAHTFEAFSEQKIQKNFVVMFNVIVSHHMMKFI